MTDERLTAVVPRRATRDRFDPADRLTRAGDWTVRAVRPPPIAPRPPPLRRVLVPLDGGPGAEHALPYALALARRSDAEPILIHVRSTLQAAGDPELPGWLGGRYLVEPLRDYLDGLAGRRAADRSVRVRPRVVAGPWPADAICAAAVRDDVPAPDLIVMAARRRGWWSRFWRGSVSAEVARRSPVPVLLVLAASGRPDLSAEPPFGRVLVPLDGTARAERALGPAAVLAALAGGECELLYVIRTRPYAGNWSLACGPQAHPGAGRAWAARRYLRRAPDPVEIPVRADPVAARLGRPARGRRDRPVRQTEWRRRDRPGQSGRGRLVRLVPRESGRTARPSVARPGARLPDRVRGAGSGM